MRKLSLWDYTILVGFQNCRQNAETAGHIDENGAMGLKVHLVCSYVCLTGSIIAENLMLGLVWNIYWRWTFDRPWCGYLLEFTQLQFFYFPSSIRHLFAVPPDRRQRVLQLLQFTLIKCTQAIDCCQMHSFNRCDLKKKKKRLTVATQQECHFHMLLLDQTIDTL